MIAALLCILIAVSVAQIIAVRCANRALDEIARILQRQIDAQGMRR